MLAAALLDALKRVRESLPDAELRSVLERLQLTNASAVIIGATLIDSILTDEMLARAFAPYRDALRDAVRHAARMTVKDIPAPRGTASVGVLFDSLSPNVITAIRTLETSALDTLKVDIREVARAYVENGLRDGVSPQEVARGLRSVIGLSPTQGTYVANLERELRSLDPAALQRVLRHRRYDAMIKRAIAAEAPLTETEIGNIVEAYRRRWITTNTEWNTRQATFDAYRSGQRLAWQGAVEQGFVDRVTKTWVHYDAQSDPRPEHVSLAGQTVAIDQPYSTGQMTAGEGDYNCKCTDRYEVAG